MSRVILPRHGRNHRIGGSDPIPMSEGRVVGCRVGVVATVAITTGVDTRVNFASSSFDTDDMWDVSEPDKIYAPFDGIYFARAGVIWGNESDTAVREVGLNIIPTTAPGGGGNSLAHTANSGMIQDCLGFLPMNAGDYCYFRVTQYSGSNKNYIAASIWVQRISPNYDYNGPLLVTGTGTIDGGDP